MDGDSEKTVISQKFLETLTQIKRGDQEFIKIQYLVQMHLGSVDTEVTAVYSLQDLQGSMAQAKNYRAFVDEGRPTILNSVVAVDELDSTSNRFQEVISKGFTIGENGLYFPCGISALTLPKSGKEVPLLMTKIAIKKTEIIKSADLSTQNISQVIKSQRFDSIFVDEKSGSDSHPFRENYILLNSHQILPCYLVYVKYVEKTFGDCEVCGKQAAKVHCENDKLDMCQTCDAQYHPPSNKVATLHKRVGILDKNLDLDNCKLHPKVKQESFCVDCRKSLCVNCQLGGFHSDPRYKGHKVVSAHDCFEFLKETRKVKSPLMIKIKSKITNLYNQVKSQSSRCMAALDQVEKQLQKIYQQTQANLVSLRQKYLDDLLSMEVGYRHKLDEIVWMEYFVKYQIDKIKPAEYIQRYFTHLALQEDFLKNMVVPDEEESEMSFDFELQGGLKIVNKSTAPKKTTAFDFSQINSSNETHMMIPASSNMTNIQSPDTQSITSRSSKRGSLKLPVLAYETPLHCSLPRFGSENKDLLSKNKLLPRTIGTLPLAFKGSTLLNSSEIRSVVFLNLVKDGSLIPKMALKSRYLKGQMPPVGSMVDLFTSIEGPLLLVGSVKGKVFGAFCDMAWQAEGTFGGFGCFIFSIENNLRLSPIASLPPSRQKRTLVFSQSDSFGWGATDLVVDHSNTWLNEVHCDYTSPGNESLDKHPICGQKQFQVDELEIWSISY